MASPTRWTWVWVNSGSWWWTGRPGVLRFMGSQRVRLDWATELNWTEWSSGLTYFLQVEPELCNKELMIWATVSFWSCFRWLSRASLSSAAKNIISLVSVLTIWWCPRVQSSLVLLRAVAMNSAFSWQNSDSLFPAHFVLQGQTCLLLQVSLNLLILHSSPLWWKWHLSLFVFGVSSRRSCRSS